MPKTTPESSIKVVFFSKNNSPFQASTPENLDSLFTMLSLWLVLYYFAFKRGRLKRVGEY